MWLNTTCCHFINESGIIETDVEKLHKIAESMRKTYQPTSDWWSWITSWLPNLGWVRGIVVTGLLILVIGLVICMCIPCLMQYMQNMVNRMLNVAVAKEMVMLSSYQRIPSNLERNSPEGKEFW